MWTEKSRLERTEVHRFQLYKSFVLLVKQNRKSTKYFIWWELNSPWNTSYLTKRMAKVLNSKQCRKEIALILYSKSIIEWIHADWSHVAGWNWHYYITNTAGIGAPTWYKTSNIVGICVSTCQSRLLVAKSLQYGGKRVPTFQQIIGLMTCLKRRPSTHYALRRGRKKKEAGNDRDSDHSFNQHDKKSYKSRRSTLFQLRLRRREASRENAVRVPYHKGIYCMWIRTNADKQKIPWLPPQVPNHFKTDKDLSFTSLEPHHSLNLNEHVVALYLGLLQYLQQAEGKKLV